MTTYLARFICCLIFLGIFPFSHAQRPMHSVIVLGNTAKIHVDDPLFERLHAHLKAHTSPTTILFTGDLVDQNGLGEKVGPTDSLRLHQLAAYDKMYPHVQVLFMPGDRDWDNSGKKGWKKVRNLEKYVENELGLQGAFLPEKGCPGPVAIELNEHLLLIGVNTQWWMHPHDKPIPADATCKISTADDFYEEFEGLIDESEHQNILIAGHHPIYSNGQYGGKNLLKKHLFPLTDARSGMYIPLPLLGSFYAAYRQNIGTPRDMANLEYGHFLSKMRLILHDRAPLIYVSGHEYDQQCIYTDNNYHINSGATTATRAVGRTKETVFKRSEKGFMQLTYFDDGRVDAQYFQVKKNALTSDSTAFWGQQLFASACMEDTSQIPVNTQYVPCAENVGFAENMDPQFVGAVLEDVVGGVEYKASGFKALFFGKHWRDSWTMPLRVPYLNMDTTFGGLTPFAEGGGRQTTSLKFKAGNGREYVFRSVNKDPYKALTRELRGTLISDVVKDQTSTQHPYGALVIDKLANHTGILHAHPKLYVLPPDATLGPFQEKFGGLFGTLEDRPKKPKNGVEGFEGADNVLRSVKLLRKLYDDHHHRVDPMAFGKARVFDIFVGDWGRHRDNWKWAGYDNLHGTVYLPIPRDRDHVFSRWDGILPWIADREWGKANAADFDFQFEGIKSLTWPARHLDRSMANALNREDWTALAKELQAEMTDEVIDEAVKNLPPELHEMSNATIGDKLKARRETLPEAIEEFYEILAKEVDIIGSNEKELFEIEAIGEGKLKVSMFGIHKKAKNPKELLYERVFSASETKEVHLFGLGGKDEFVVINPLPQKIKVCIIPGDGSDKVILSEEKEGKKALLYGWNDDKDKIVGTASNARVVPVEKTFDYQYDRFAYNTYLPIPSLSYNPDNGFGIGLGIQWTTHNFHKPDYASKHSFNLSTTTLGNVNGAIKSRFRHVLGKWDFGLLFRYAGPDRRLTNFYGLGSETEKNDSLFQANYYRVNLRTLEVMPSLTLDFAEKSEMSFGLSFEQSTPEAFQDDAPNILTDGVFPGENVNSLAGVHIDIHVDFRDHATFAKQGIELRFTHRSFLDVEESNDPFGVTSASLAYYFSTHWQRPITLAFRAGGADAYNNAPFYKLPSLGRATNLRGYFRDRFTGSTTAYANGEVRMQFGEVFQSFLPTQYGILGFVDVGQVWMDGVENTNDPKTSYGFGLFLAPLTNDLTMTLSAAFSEEESMMIAFGFGFFVQ